MNNHVIVDIDGTICDASHRMHLIEQEPKDWAAWYAGVTRDAPIKPVLRLVHTLSYHHRIVLMTGRSEVARELTQDWLRMHVLRYDRLLMRSQNDRREDTEVKADLYRNHFKPGEVWLVLEDRDRVVRMWRELGLTCLQVRDGNY